MEAAQRRLAQRVGARDTTEVATIRTAATGEEEAHAGVTASVEGQTVKVKGPKGALQFVLPDEVTAKMEGGGVKVDPRNETKRARSMWGTSRTMVANLVTGVTKGFERKLTLVGVGFFSKPWLTPRTMFATRARRVPDMALARMESSAPTKETFDPSTLTMTSPSCSPRPAPWWT